MHYALPARKKVGPHKLTQGYNSSGTLGQDWYRGQAMIWDGFVTLVLISLCMAGWNVGIINSWRGPIAMVIATVVTQLFYIDFGTWIVQQTLIQPNFAAYLAYLMMWLIVEISTEIAMSLVLTWNRKERPMIFDRLGGVALAFVRWGLICTLPLMAMLATNCKIPEPQKKDDGLINPMKVGLNDSHILTSFGTVAKGLLPGLGPAIVSGKEPSFKPNFDKPKVNLE